MRWLVLVLVPAIAHADVDASATAGVDSSEGASAAADVSAELIGQPRPCPCAAFGSAPDLLRGELSATFARSSYGDMELTGRLFGWQLALRETVQPVGSLRDTFWRSGRGIDDTTIAFAMPAFVEAGGVRVASTTETVDVYSNGDSDFAAAVSAVGGAHWAVFHVDATSRTRGELEADQFAFDLVALDVVGIHLEAGADVTTAFGEAGEVDSPRYRLGISHAFGELSGTFELGSWTRIDPAGTAVDTGQLVTGELAWQHGRYAAHASVDAGRLVRRFGDAAPIRAMGRAELEGDVQLAHSLAMIGTAWAERSDRDDPRWAVPSNGAVIDHAGVGIAARWRLKNVTAPLVH
jgi:hypothetical protein